MLHPPTITERIHIDSVLTYSALNPKIETDFQSFSKNFQKHFRMIDDIDEFESIALIRFPANIAEEIDKEIKAEEDAIKVRGSRN